MAPSSCSHRRTGLVSPWDNLPREDGTPSAKPRREGWCADCNAYTKEVGPWCESSFDLWGRPCRLVVKRRLHQADAEGDGPLVNALCEYGRRRWGEDLEW